MITPHMIVQHVILHCMLFLYIKYKMLLFMMLREEVIEYYSQLSAEASRREQKALWRIRRAKLDLKRTEFLLQEDRNLAAEMEKIKSDPV